jgi:hypothetical protein
LPEEATNGTETLEVTQLEALAQRALIFQNYIMRRAWGIYYAIWAIAITVFLSLPTLVQSFVPIAMIGWPIYATAYSLVGCMAGIATFRLFSGAGRTIALRRVVSREEQRRYWFIPLLWVLAFYSIVGSAFAFSAVHAMAILFVSILSIDVYLAYALKRTFQRITFEGKLAVASYGFGALVGLSTTFLIDLPFLNMYSTLVWGAVPIVWVFCSVYALYHASEELVGLHEHK